MTPASPLCQAPGGCAGWGVFGYGAEAAERWFCAAHRELGERPGVPEHHCHARGCTAEVPPEMLMCGRHWRMVPRPLQVLIWQEYRPGQCDDKRPSRDWVTFANKAIELVAERERPSLAARRQGALW